MFVGSEDKIDGLDYKYIDLKPEEFDKLMCTDFPDIFQNRHKPMSETCMCWGFNIGAGWYPLLYKLCSQLREINKVTGLLPIADQVKEKFGGLRFYYHVSTPEGTPIALSKEQLNIWDSIIDKLCHHAEDDSFHICASCGKFMRHDQIYLGSWVYDECIVCFKKHNPDMVEEVDAWYKETKQEDKNL